MSDMMTFGSLFSGFGGLDLGLERAGMRCAWQVEINEYARRVLERHWPNVRRWNDVRTFPPTLADSHVKCGISGSEIPQREAQERAAYWCYCDIIAGGFPCQPVSLAGRRQAQRDQRWLWPHFARVVRLLRPRYVLVENPPGLLSLGGWDVLGELAEMGLDAEWATVPASAFGAPHIRERVYLVAYSRSIESSERYHPNLFGRRSASPEQVRVGSSNVADTVGSNGVGDMPEARIFQSGRAFTTLPEPCWGSDKPGVARTLDGVPHRMERITGVGNAVVPQTAEWLGRQIMAYEEANRKCLTPRTT